MNREYLRLPTADSPLPFSTDSIANKIDWLYMNQADEIRKQYELGKKEFEKLELANADLKEINLSFANLKGADLSGADLSGAILHGCDLQGANLNRAKLNGAKLRGANLSEARIAWGSFIGADLTGANLAEASLDAATLKKAIFLGTNLRGAFLYGAELDQALLTGAYYNERTRFESDFNPVEAGMRVKAQISIEKLLKQFNSLSQLSHKYLGSRLTSKYWESSRPNVNWLNQFQIIHSSAQINFSGSINEFIDLPNLYWSQLWINIFIKNSSQIVQDLPALIEQKQLVLTLALLDSASS